MGLIRSVLREPLVHFLVLGGALFLVAGLADDSGDGADEIVVSAGQVEALAESFARTWRRPPTAAELDGLIDDHIDEEVLYREALALGLDRGDGAIRRRLRQKMEFLGEDMTRQAEPTDQELAAFLAEHQDRFRRPWRASFVQVYLSPDRRGDQAWVDAERLLGEVAGGAEPTTLGDPFLLEPAFERVTEYDVERLFGRDFATQLADLPVGAWVGPLRSGYGLHLVRLDERTPATLPPLDEIRAIVTRDWQDARRRAAKEAFTEALRARYRITVERPPETGGGAIAGRP